MASKKTIVSITGIRPDFIRMSVIFKKLDENFNHILIHTGQHYDALLSDVFFSELNIRKPDYTLECGVQSTNHYEQASYLYTHVIKLIKSLDISPDLIIFLGDSNSTSVAFPLKKEGYKIGHIEAGMRSYDKRMLEEINRVVCDNCSDILFVYHDDYKTQLALENIKSNVVVVGNTIVEPCMQIINDIARVEKRKDMILMDIHRPENMNYPDRIRSIIAFGNMCRVKYAIPVKLLYFKRLVACLTKYNINIGDIQLIDLLPYKKYLDTVYHSRFIISDSGTAQEEPALLNTHVIVPRDYSERQQSYQFNCSFKLDVGSENYSECFKWINDVESGDIMLDSSWLGNGSTSDMVINGIKQFLCK